jgi:hypothetical protein
VYLKFEFETNNKDLIYNELKLIPNEYSEEIEKLNGWKKFYRLPNINFAGILIYFYIIDVSRPIKKKLDGSDLVALAPGCCFFSFKKKEMAKVWKPEIDSQ